MSMRPSTVDPKNIKTGINVVAEDINWVYRIQNELNCASKWNQEW